MSLTLSMDTGPGPWQWRWLLTDDDSGSPVADHDVHLDPASAEVKAFQCAYETLRWGFIAEDQPDQRLDVARLGAFVGESALGDSVVRAIIKRTPVTVRMKIPVAAEWLTLLPWELARIDGESLAARDDVTLVYDLLSVPPSLSAKEPVKEAVRILGVFSQPTSTPGPILRRERLDIERLARGLARSRRRMEFTVAQYGTTRDQLAELAGDGKGWDILHLSADTATGRVILQHPDGRPDSLSSAELLDALSPVKRRLKLVVLTAHESFAATTALALADIGDVPAARSLYDQARAEGTLSAANLGPLALDLARKLACAVVAMRHPVMDPFHSVFNARLYKQLLESHAPVDQAVAVARRAALNGVKSDPSGMCAPVIYGRSAPKLTIEPPKTEPSLKLNASRVAYLPDEPDLFMGQNDAMLAANRALAPDSKQFGVLFWGGTGKTWCASELAHRNQQSFEALVYWRFPPGQPFNDGFSSLAKAWEQQLSQYGFSMVKEVVTSSALEAYLPKLRVLLRDHGLLIVLDGVDPLLTADGVWRDPRWPALVDVLTGHKGESRVVFTSRGKPSRLDLPAIEMQRIGPLSRYESLHLARQLPALGPWLNDELPVAGDALGGTRREVALSVLNRWQGHPQLLAYADIALSPGAPLPDGGEIAAAARAAAAAADGTGAVPDAASIEQTLQDLARLRPAESAP